LEEWKLTEYFLNDIRCMFSLLFTPENPVRWFVWVVEDSEGREGEDGGRGWGRNARV
jgi:hypothetical protein